MPSHRLSDVIQQLRRSLRDQGPELTDAQLLMRFVRGREPAALEELVRRHGPMAWGVCRRILGNDHDAEDAFQATFLVLVRKASSIRPQAKVGNWLYGVARQTALKARATRARRRTRETPVDEMPEPAVMERELWSDLEPWLDQEVSRLPEKYRTVIVLCELEGKTVREAARQLGCPEGTVGSRLARARALLARQLARHGLAVTGGTLAAVLSQKAATASVPMAVLSSTVRAVTRVAAGPAAPGLISAPVSALTNEVLKSMLLTKLKMAAALLLVAAALCGAAWCAHTSQAAEPAAQQERDRARQAGDPPLQGLAVRPQVPAEHTARVAKDNTAFALDLYARLRSQEGNLFYSPLSMSAALGMTYAGARGETADEMAKALHFDLGPDRLHPALGSLLRDLSGQGKERGYQLSVANALWPQKGYPFLPAFLDLTHKSYDAGLEEVDFRGATEPARKKINHWVEEHTQDRIKELLKPGVLDSNTCLVLTNAIYFKGDWLSRFNKDHTREAPFHVTARDKVMVPLMSQKGHFGYLEGESFQAVEMPYVGKDLSMVVFLPRKVDGLADFEKLLTAERLTGWLGKLYDTEVRVSLPRFKVTAELDLVPTLSALGMKRAFTGQADFSGLDGSKSLFLSAVAHKAFVDVNEEGTEAAAATAVVVAKESARANPVFRADHPFVFLIRDRRSGSILFLGRLVHPGK
jgi:serpin B